MGVSLATTKFNELRGPQPLLPEAVPVLHTRPGTAGVGARIQPAKGPECQITLVRLIAEASRFSQQYGYRSLIGTVVTYTFEGTSWATTFGYNFLVLGVEVLESRPMVKAVGVDPDGSTFEYTPAGLIVSRWRLAAVPVP